MFGARNYGGPSRFLAEIPRELTDREEQAPRRDGRVPRPRDLVDLLGGPRPAGAVAYRLGDDVIHPAFGEGVVTGLEPGGIVVIRFSQGRSERKLVADLAPISKR